MVSVNRDRFRFELFVTGKRVCMTIDVDLRILAVAIAAVVVVSLLFTRTVV